ncbi:GIN domain-containing protein [Dehalococcoides mccartyi]|uniref:DUF2807 domain-containing protein n=1 Tax=Dehalococcoides mccartyi TaxID=61435 RepID=A0AB38Z9R9_9CHLR|nr:DUF2807 domain-containing protein [Dehalococcoides mccartyi]WRO07335.1 DUF2807 domain-containing protein [Dehalococcoides mccartyi]
MKKAGLLGLSVCIVFIMALLGGGCIPGVGGFVTGSGEVENRSFDYAGFNRVEVSNAITADILYAGSFEVSVSTHENIFEYLELEKSGQTLKIGLKDSYTFMNVTIEAVIRLPELVGLSVSGASRVNASGFDSANDFTALVDGASRLTLHNMQVGQSSFYISGASTASGELICGKAAMKVSAASRLELSGQGGDIEVLAEGASTASLENFLVASARVEATGVSNIRIYTDGELYITASGVSSVKYFGNPVIKDLNVSDVSSAGKG